MGLNKMRLGEMKLGEMLPNHYICCGFGVNFLFVVDLSYSALYSLLYNRSLQMEFGPIGSST